MVAGLKADSYAKAIARFLLDESGQDLIEYAMLTAFIGLVGALAWVNIRAGVGAKFSGWGSGIQSTSACTPDPQAFGGAPGP
jgi:Flp pilus assembly pilin Flp